MTVQELRWLLEEYEKCGFGSYPVYLYNGDCFDDYLELKPDQVAIESGEPEDCVTIEVR